MSTDTANVSHRSVTTINGLLRNLLELTRIKDSRTAYFAAAAFERLMSLRADALAAGFPQWDLMQRAPLTHANLAASYRAFMASLKDLVEALQAPRFWSLDASTRNVSEQIEAAWEALKESA